MTATFPIIINIIDVIDITDAILPNETFTVFQRSLKFIFTFSYVYQFLSIFPFLYHTTITLAFSSQESSICLSLQFSERSLSKDFSEVKTIDDA